MVESAPMILKALFVILALTAVGGVRATVTNVIDAVALGRLGNGVSSDGWTVTSVSNYSETSKAKSALRLNKETSEVVSPRFEAGILQVKLRLCSSSATGKRLLVATPLRNGEPIDALRHVFELSQKEYGINVQTADWAAEARVRAFRLHLEGSGVTGWGILEMSVVTADRVPPLVIVVR